MRSRTLFALALFASVFMFGCATPDVPQIGGNPSKTAAAKGGDAEGDTLAAKTNIAIAQPGADVRLVPIENSDQVTSTQAAPAFTLNLVADVGAAIAADPVLKSLTRTLVLAERRLSKAVGDDIAAATAAVNVERAALAERLNALQDKFMSAGSATITSLYFQPVVIMSNAEDVAKLDAATTHAASRGLLGAVLLGLDDETAKAVAAALAQPGPEPAE